MRSLIESRNQVINLDNGEWTYDDSKYVIHGQYGHKMNGSCGYVNWSLMTGEVFNWIYRDVSPKGETAVTYTRSTINREGFGTPLFGDKNEDIQSMVR